MRLVDGTTLKKVRGKLVLLVYDGPDSKAMEVNESFAFLWEEASKGDFVPELLANALVKEYDIDESTAIEETRKTLLLWKQLHLLKEE